MWYCTSAFFAEILGIFFGRDGSALFILVGFGMYTGITEDRVFFTGLVFPLIICGKCLAQNNTPHFLILTVTSISRDQFIIQALVAFEFFISAWMYSDPGHRRALLLYKLGIGQSRNEIIIKLT